MRYNASRCKLTEHGYQTWHLIVVQLKMFSSQVLIRSCQLGNLKEIRYMLDILSNLLILP